MRNCDLIILETFIARLLLNHFDCQFLSFHMVGKVIKVYCSSRFTFKIYAFYSYLLVIAAFTLRYFLRLELINTALLFGFVFLENNNLF